MAVSSLTLWQCTNEDAINFSTQPVYAAPVTKTFAQWGIADMWSFVKGGCKDKVTLKFPGQALSTNSPFTFRSKALITIDGKNFFMGKVTDDPRKKTGRTDEMTVTIMGPWWELENLIYQWELNILTGFNGNNPVYTPYGFTKFTLNLLPSYTFTAQGGVTSIGAEWIETIVLYNSQQMICGVAPANGNQGLQGILPFAISQGAWIAAGNILNVAVVPKDVMDITCAQAILRQCEDYDVAIWFDYSGATPRLNITQRKNLPALTRSLLLPGGSFDPTKNIEGFTLRERTDLKCPYVQIMYEQPETVGGVSTIAQYFDVYPPPPGWVFPNAPVAPTNSLKALITTVPLLKINVRTKAKFIQTLAIDMTDVSAGGFWQTMFPEMNVNTNPNAATEFANLAVVDYQRGSNLPNVIIRGGYSPQMGGAVARDNLIVRFSYQRMLDANRPGSKVSFHTKNKRALVTNLNFPNGVNFTFTHLDSYDPFDPFEGLAQEIYEDLNPPNGLWEGTVPLLESTYSGEIEMGFALNLDNTLPEHAEMAALIQSISGTVRSGAIAYSLEIGPNKTISAQQITDRIRAARTSYIQVFNFGTTPGNAPGTSAESLPTDEMTDAASETEPALSQHNVNAPVLDADGQPDPSGNVNNVQIDATGGITVQTLDPTGAVVPTAPTMTLAAADITANDTFNA